MNRLLFTAMAALLAGAPLSQVRAQETTPSPTARAQTRDEVRQILKTDGKMSEKDLKGVETDIDQFAAHGGHGAAVSQLVHAAQAETPPCLGQCLADRLRALNGAMSAANKAAAEAHRDRAQAREEQNENAHAKAREHERETATGSPGESHAHGRH